MGQHLEVKLNAEAVMALFAEPETRLELQRAVTAEILKQLWPNYVRVDVQKDLVAVLEAAKPELLELARQERNLGELVTQRVTSMKANLRGQVTLGQQSEEMKRLVDERIERVVKVRIEERVGNMSDLVDRRADIVVQRIENNMERWITEAVERRIKQGIEQAIDKMKAAI